MSPIQAGKLPIGARVRRKGAGGDAEVHTVERIEYPTRPKKESVIVHAGGHAFKPWEIERAEP